MKIKYFFLSILFLHSFWAYSQPKKVKIITSKTCGFNSIAKDDEIFVNDLDNSSREYVKKICDEMAIDYSTIALQRANVENAISTFDEQNNAYLYFSAAFFQSISEAQKIAILAHEIAHIINRHPLTSQNRRVTDELVADEFAGRVLCKMNINVNEAKQVFINNCSTQSSEYYPPRSARIESLVIGYEKGGCTSVISASEIIGNINVRVRINNNDKSGSQSAYTYYLSGDKKYLDLIKEVRYKRNHDSFSEYAGNKYYESEDRVNNFPFKGYQWGWIKTAYLTIILKNGTKSSQVLKTLIYDE